MLGKPAIRETRIPMGLILRKLSEGVSETDTLAGYLRLTGDDVCAALRSAADIVAHEGVVFIGKNRDDA